MDTSSPAAPSSAVKPPRLNLRLKTQYAVNVVRCQLVRDGAVMVESQDCSGPRQAAEAVRAHIGNADREHFVALLVNARNRMIAIHTVSIGTLTASLVHPREVFKPALLANAAGVIVAHNHPSGNCQPSAEDRAATTRLEKAGRMLGVPILDHVIVGDGEAYFSFREAGALNG